MKTQTAKEKFTKFGGEEEQDDVERLRFFCSLSMQGQDWIDVEPFINDVVTERDALKAELAAVKDLATCECGDGFTPHDKGVCVNCLVSMHPVAKEVHPDKLFATQLSYENGEVKIRVITKEEAYLPPAAPKE